MTLAIETIEAPAIAQAPAYEGIAFEVDASELQRHLSSVARAVPSRPNQPILANILFEADAEAGMVALTAYDLTMGIVTRFGASCRTGRVTIPAKLLGDIVSKLSGQIRLVETAPEQISITCASGQYEIRGIDAEDYPELPKVGEAQAVSIDRVDLISALGATLGCTSTDETKQVLTGVRIEIGEKGATFAATDGHRLAVCETLATGELETVIPAKALRDLQRLAQASDAEEIRMIYDRGQVLIQISEMQTLITRTLDGTYPNYRQLIPADFAGSATVDRLELLKAAERVAVVASQKNSVIKIVTNPDENTLLLSADAQDVGSGQEMINCQANESQAIAFNVGYVLDALKQINSTDVAIWFNTPTSPVVIRPAMQDDLTYLVMPVQVRS